MFFLTKAKVVSCTNGRRLCQWLQKAGTNTIIDLRNRKIQGPIYPKYQHPKIWCHWEHKKCGTGDRRHLEWRSKDSKRVLKIQIWGSKNFGNKLCQAFWGMGHGAGWRGLLEEEEQSEEFVKEFSVIIKKHLQIQQLQGLKSATVWVNKVWVQ